MERKIGEVFMDGENKLTVCKGEDCHECFYGTDTYPWDCEKFLPHVGYCSDAMRDDFENVIFKIVKK